MKSDFITIGHWALVIGIVLAIIASFAVIPALPIALFVLGLIVGLLNIKEKESTPFLVAVIALLLTGVAGLQLGGLTPIVALILNNFVAFMAAAALVVAIKQVLAVAKPTF